MYYSFNIKQQSISNTSTAPVYGVHSSQLIPYARAGSLYSDVLQRRRILSTKLLNQGFLKNVS